MRVIGGVLRGRRLVAPEGLATRPTSDRARQTLFDVLLHAPWGGRALFEGARVLDAFAGTGALAIEALSRGAAEAVLFETDAPAIAAIRRNLAACGLAAQARVLRADATRPPAADGPAELVFLDPPYGEGLVERALPPLAESGWIAPGTVLVVETAAEEAVPLEGFVALDDRRVGRARLTVLRAGKGAFAAQPEEPANAPEPDASLRTAPTRT